MKPTLLAINNYYYLRGGAEFVLLAENRMLEAEGWDVVPFAMRHPNNLPTPWERFFVDEIEFGHSYGLADKLAMAGKVIYSREAQRKLNALLAEVKPTVAHAHNVYHHISPSIFPVLKKSGVPTVLTLHDLKLACPAYTMRTNGAICERCKSGHIHNVVVNRCIKGSIALSSVVFAETAVNRLLKSYSANVDRFVVPSRFFMEKLAEWGFPAERFTHVPNFVDASNFTPSRDAGRGFVYFGRLAPEKGLDVAIKAAKLAGEPLTVVGTGPEEPRLRRLADVIGADVHFAGYQKGEDLYRIVRAARATVLASTWYENAPLSVLESYALAKPVIGADIGGIPELVREGETGTLVPSDHVGKLAERMRWMASLPDVRVRDMGQAARQWVERDFSQSAYRDRMLQIYGELSGDRAPAAAPLAAVSQVRTSAQRAKRAEKGRLSVMMLGLRGCPDVQGGVEKHVEQLAPRLAGLGCDVEVVGRQPYIEGAAAREWNGIHITPLWSPGGKSSEALIHTLIGVLYAAVRRPDVLHIHAIGPSLMVPLARLLGLKVVVTHHGYDYERQKWGRLAKTVLKAGEWLGMRLANGRITVSNGIASAMRSRHGVEATAIPNGVDFAGMTANAGSHATLNSFGLTPGRYVLTVGRLVREKRQLDLIEAFGKAGLYGWKLAIVGAADHPDEYSRLLEQVARRTPNVVMTGYQSGTALSELYANAGMFVLPSSHEGLPIALLEAASLGLTCLASGIEANREVDLPANRYFPVGDTAALARLMSSLAVTPQSDAEAARLRSYVRDTYDWQRSAERTLAVYRGAAEARTGDGGKDVQEARPQSA
jgi:glycosyltransferase involved in cell wall biosynthesis